MKQKLTIGIATLTVLVLVVSGCGSKDTAAPTKSVGQVTANGVSAERCQANRKAGRLTYLTSFDYAASASIIDVVAAEAQGYFQKMCLDVKLQAGFTTDNVPLVSSGQAAFSSLSSASEVAAAAAKDAKIKAIALYGHQAIDELVVSEKANIDSLSQLKGTTMGVLGSIPYDIRTMLVTNGVPLDSFKQLNVPFDITLLDKGDFQSRPVYKSSEPRQLDQAGIEYKVFDPSTTNTPASFGAMIVSNDFAAKHPTAVEDFLRADLKGFQYALANPESAVKAAFDKSDAGKYYFTRDGEQFRWNVEADLVKKSTPSGKPYGYMDSTEWTREIAPLQNELGLISKSADVSSFYDRSYLDHVYEGTNLVWPRS